MTLTQPVPFEVIRVRYIIGTMSLNCAWGEACRADLHVATPNSNAWPAANLGLFLPVFIYERVTVYEAYTATGTLTGGNLDIGIFSTGGTKLASTGSTARAAASSWQTVGMTDYVWEPGEYYIGMVADDTSNYLAHAPTAGKAQAVGMVEDASAWTAGFDSSVTYVTSTRAFVPHFGFVCRSTTLA